MPSIGPIAIFARPRTSADFGHRCSRPACVHRSIRARRPPAGYWDTPPCCTARRTAVARVRRGAFALQRPTRHRSSRRAMLVLRRPQNRRTRPSRAREGLDPNAMPPPLSRSVRDLEREDRGRHHIMLQGEPRVARPIPRQWIVPAASRIRRCRGARHGSRFGGLREHKAIWRNTALRHLLEHGDHCHDQGD